VPEWILTGPSVAPPQLSEEEMREAEAAASLTVRQFVTTSAVLYLCASPSGVHDSAWSRYQKRG